MSKPDESRSSDSEGEIRTIQQRSSSSSPSSDEEFKTEAVLSSPIDTIDVKKEEEEELYSSMIDNTVVWADGTTTGGVVRSVDQHQQQQQADAIITTATTDGGIIPYVTTSSSKITRRKRRREYDTTSDDNKKASSETVYEDVDHDDAGDNDHDEDEDDGGTLASSSSEKKMRHSCTYYGNNNFSKVNNVTTSNNHKTVRGILEEEEENQECNDKMNDNNNVDVSSMVVNNVNGDEDQNYINNNYEKTTTKRTDSPASSDDDNARTLLLQRKTSPNMSLPQSRGPGQSPAARKSNTNNKMWMETYQRLVVFKKQHNTTNVPRRYKEDPKLGTWVATQRSTYRNKTIKEKRCQLLNSINFDWGNGRRAPKTDWMEKYQRLVVYKTQYNITYVPVIYKEDPKLGRWVSSQRAAYNNKTMKEERCQLLNSINFNWGNGKRALITDWMDTYQRLVSYKKQHNTTNVPNKYKEDPKLGTWVAKQRRDYNNKTIKKERCQLLNSINFNWGNRKQVPITDWMETYQRLVAYKKQYNTTKVHAKDDPKLGRWISHQRAAYNNKTIKEERCQLLNAINFDWGNGKPDWMDVYQRLVAYKKQYNNTNVPNRYKEDPKLGSWVGTQRVTYKDKTMKEERYQLLTSIGFRWSLQAQRVSSSLSMSVATSSTSVMASVAAGTRKHVYQLGNHKL